MTTSLVPISRRLLVVGIAFLSCVLLDALWYDALSASAAGQRNGITIPSLALSLAALCIYVYWGRQLRRQLAGGSVAYALQLHCFSPMIISLALAQWVVFVLPPMALASSLRAVPLTIFLVSISALVPAHALHRLEQAR